MLIQKKTLRTYGALTGLFQVINKNRFHKLFKTLHWLFF